MVLLAALPMYFVYLKNAEMLPFVSILKPMLICAVCYCVVYTLAAIITARAASAALVVGSSLFFVFNFSILLKVFSFLQTDVIIYTVSVIACVAIAIGVFLLLRRIRRHSEVLNVFMLMFTLVLLGITVFNTANSWNNILHDINTYRASTVADGSMSADDAAEIDENIRQVREKIGRIDKNGMPNIYFFVFDEMGGFSAMDTYYNYDLSSFTAFLDANNINYSSDSHSKYTKTYSCITDLLCYTRGAAEERINVTLNEKTPLNKELTAKGYKLYNMSVSSRIFRGVPDLLDSMESVTDFTTEDGLTPEDIAYENSILQIILSAKKQSEYVNNKNTMSSAQIIETPGYGKLSKELRHLVKSQLTAFDCLSNPDILIPNAGIAIFTYMKTTHVPFLFNADGSILESSADYRNWRDSAIYTGCYTFTLSRLQNAMTSIISHDPDSIILVLGDHGVRHHLDCTLKHQFVIADEDETNIINLLYYRGEKLNIQSLTPTDTIRIVLNLLGSNIDLESGISMNEVVLQ